MDILGRDPTVRFPETALDLMSARQVVLSGNVANAESSNYRTRDIDFQSELRRQARVVSETLLERPHSNHIAGNRLNFSPSIHEVKGLVMGPDGNNVDVEREMIQIYKTGGLYSMSARLLSAKIAYLRGALTGGRG